MESYIINSTRFNNLNISNKGFQTISNRQNLNNKNTPYFDILSFGAFELNKKLYPEIYENNKVGFENAFIIMFNELHIFSPSKIKISFGGMPSLIFIMTLTNGFKIKFEYFFESEESFHAYSLTFNNKLISRNIGSLSEMINDINDHLSYYSNITTSTEKEEFDFYVQCA